MKMSKSLIAAVLMLAYTSSSLAAVSAEEAKKLGTTLTAVGAEKAGNADGSIPAYDGTAKKYATAYHDPYADEKPLFTITAKNMDQYAGKLTEGQKYLLKKNPATYRINVYKTHRPVVFPKFVLDRTAKNAVTAKTANNGLTLKDAVGGTPFPIPKDGYEVMWNHLVRYSGEGSVNTYRTYYVDRSGKMALATKGTITNEYPYNYKNNRADIALKTKVMYHEAARRAGEAIMVVDPLNMADKQRQAWQYLPGQRRVKLAPEVSFDTPQPGSGGISTYDDVFLFNGSMERYNFKLIGKREVYIPYNWNKQAFRATPEEICMPNHRNPDVERWELHRVWVVEATLKPGKRHIYTKRLFYVDEDSWAAVASDAYDARGQLFRSQFTNLLYDYEHQAIHSDSTATYDFIAGGYSPGSCKLNNLKRISPLPAKEWSPDSLAGSGVR